MRKTVVIGHFDWINNTMIGASVKARNIYYSLREYDKSVSCVDIYNWKKHTIKTMIKLIYFFFRNNNVVLVISKTNPIFISFISILKRIFNNDLYYVVVGADIAKTLKDNPERKRKLNCIKCFYVETPDLVDSMKKIGIKNVKLLKNFKILEEYHYENCLSDEKIIKFCIFSRIIKNKGVTDAVLAIHKVNTCIENANCVIDIYGPIDNTYQEEFLNLLKKIPEAKYYGVVDERKSVNILKNYYCLLFPTMYSTEGIPGTIIDAFAAGLPVICSDWPRRKYLITNKYNGLVYPFLCQEELFSQIMYAIENPTLINEMKKNCIESYNEYKPEIAIRPLLDDLNHKRI